MGKAFYSVILARISFHVHALLVWQREREVDPVPNAKLGSSAILRFISWHLACEKRTAVTQVTPTPKITESKQLQLWRIVKGDSGEKWPALWTDAAMLPVIGRRMRRHSNASCFCKDLEPGLDRPKISSKLGAVWSGQVRWSGKRWHEVRVSMSILYIQFKRLFVYIYIHIIMRR